MTFNCIVKCILDGYNNNKKKGWKPGQIKISLFSKKKKIKIKNPDNATPLTLHF